MFELASHPRTRELTVVTSSQQGKTTALLIIPMHRMHDGPRVPVMFVAPSKELVKSIAERFSAAVARCAPLSRLMAGGRRDRVFEKFFARVRFGFAWAGSKIQLRSHPVGIAIVDELDACPENTEGEGHISVLLAARTKNYIASLQISSGTPTIDGASAIQSSWEAGSRYVREWQCPHCEDWYQPRAEHLRWPDGADANRAESHGWLACGCCGATIDDDAKPNLLARARWWPYDIDADGIPQPCAEWRDSGLHASFWATGFFSPWVTIKELRRRLCAAYRTRDPAQLQPVLNTYFGEWWSVRGDRPEWERVRSKVGTFSKGQSPDWTRGILLAVDVQRDRLEWQCVAFGENYQHASFDWGVLFGNPEYDDVWLALSAMRTKAYRGHRIARCIVDSGYRPGYDHYLRPEHKVYAWVRGQAGWAVAYKGNSQQRETARLSKSQADGILFLVNPDHYKSMIYANIRNDSDQYQVPSNVDDEFCKSLVSEELVAMPGGRMLWRVRRGEPNHQLDCLVMGLALASILNWQQSPPPPRHATPKQIDTSYVLGR